MAALPYIQLYIADFQADTAHLTLEQKGAYLELIMNYWQTEKPLNNSDKRIASVLKISKRRFQTMEKILSEFFTIKDDIWTHQRIEYDLEKVLIKSKKASFAATEGARKRSNERLANARRTPAIEIETKIEIETIDKKKKISVIKDDHDQEFSTFWLMYPRKVGKLAAQKAFEKALKSATPQEIFEGVIRYQRTCGTDPKFITHPSTWLNQGRWMDVAQSNPKPLLEGSHSQSLNQFEASEATSVPPKFTVDDIKAPTKPFKSWRELAGESE